MRIALILISFVCLTVAVSASLLWAAQLQGQVDGLTFELNHLRANRADLEKDLLKKADLEGVLLKKDISASFKIQSLTVGNLVVGSDSDGVAVDSSGVRILSQGITRGGLMTIPGSGAVLGFTRENGTLASTIDEGSVLLRDDQGKRRCALGQNLEVYDESGKMRAALGCVSLIDDHGTKTLTHAGTLVLFKEDGHVGIQLPLDR